MNHLQVVDYKGQRVLLTGQLASSYGTSSERISKNFYENKKRYLLGKHYYLLQGAELKAFKNDFRNSELVNKQTSSLYLWTEKGAWLHAKSLNTEEAWEAYELLVDEYYRIQDFMINIDLLSPEMKMFKMTFDSIAKMQIENNQTKRELEEVKTTVTDISETLLNRDVLWRTSINNMLNAAAKRLGGGYQELRKESYRLLQERGKYRLNIKLENLKRRLLENGATKSKVKQTNKLDVIEADPRIKEIYTTIVKELAIGARTKNA